MDNVIKISDGFYSIEEDGVRSFLFVGDERAMLVDTGFGTLNLREIVSELTRLPVFLVNTHSDHDHTGCNCDFKPVYMHPAEMERYKSSLPMGCSMDDVLPLWEGDVIDLGRWKFEVILTPGHTPGSIMLLERSKRMLISGDTVQNGEIYMFGPGRSMTAFQSSIKKLIALSDCFDTVWPSHGDCPLKSDIVPRVLETSLELMAGRLPEQAPTHKLPCKRYAGDAVAFLYCFE